LKQQLKEFNFIPPVQVYLQCQLDLLIKQYPRVNMRRHVRLSQRQVITRSYHSANHETWAMLEHVYRWTMTDQLEWESVLGSIQSLPFLVQHPVLDKLVPKDTELPGIECAGSLLATLTRQIIESAASLGWDIKKAFDVPYLGWVLSQCVTFSPNRIFFSSRHHFLDTIAWQLVNVLEEELVKRFSISGVSVGFYWLVGLESMIKVANYFHTGETRHFVGALLGGAMHLISYRLGFWRGLAFHFCWNLVVFGLVYLGGGDAEFDRMAAASAAHPLPPPAEPTGTPPAPSARGGDFIPPVHHPEPSPLPGQEGAPFDPLDLVFGCA